MLPKFKNCQGFFSLHFIFFITLISMTLLSYTYIYYSQKQKDLFRKTCYFDLVDIQKQLVRFEKQLFLFNAPSTALRLQLKVLYAELLLAQSNPPLAAKIIVEIKAAQAAQKQLDHLQKALITSSNFYLKQQISKLMHELYISDQHEKRIWEQWLSDRKSYDLKPATILAVQPDSIGGVAPNYELKPDYERLQALILSLHSTMKNRIDTQTMHFYCTVSFNKKDQVWTLKINQDRPLLIP